MKELNENALIKEQLFAAINSADESEFNRLLQQCADFRTVFDVTIECADRNLKNKMESGLQRMFRLSKEGWVAVLGNDAQLLVRCLMVIENNFSPWLLNVKHPEGETMARYRYLMGRETLGYLLWTCCPQMANRHIFPNIAGFLLNNEEFRTSLLELAFRDANWHSHKYWRYFNFVDKCMKAGKLPADYFSEINQGGKLRGLFQLWCESQKIIIAFLGAWSRSRWRGALNKDIARVIARNIHHVVSMLSFQITSFGLSRAIESAERSPGSSNHVPMLKEYIVNAYTVPDTFLLVRAGESVALHAVRLLLEMKADANETDDLGDTALSYVVQSGQTPFLNPVLDDLKLDHPTQAAIHRENQIGVVRLLLNAGAIVNKEYVHKAKNNGHSPKLIQLLEDAEREQVQRKKPATIVMGLGKYKMGMFKPLPQGLTRQIAQMIVNPALTIKAV